MLVWLIAATTHRADRPDAGLRRFDRWLSLASRSLAQAEAIKTFPLDDQTVYHLKVGTDKVTTLVFPQPITALEGSGITADPKTRAEDVAQLSRGRPILFRPRLG